MGLPYTRIDIRGTELMKRLLGLVACSIVIMAPVVADEKPRARDLRGEWVRETGRAEPGTGTA
jgi:hypothetical protein